MVAPTVDGIATAQVAGPRDATSLSVQLAESLSASGTAIELDLAPTLGVQIAARLYQQHVAHAALVLPRWPYAEAILPTAELVATLVVDSFRLDPPTEHLRNVAFVLDAERHQPIERLDRDDPRVDNRYQLTTADLPNLAELRRAGIERVLKVSHT